jgi:8-oxo-dGTP pyrophosphatase MutT (NUDIX family)
MGEASWAAVEGAAETIEENWLFRLVRGRFRSARSGREHAFYVVELADAVHVIAETRDRRVVLVRQFRAGSGRDGHETPGGLVEPGEDPLEAGARELLEETGYAGDPPVLVSTCWANPSLLTSRITTIWIANARKVAEVKPDENEELEVVLVPRSAIPRWIREGRIGHALCVQGLLAWMVGELPNAPWPLPRRGPRGVALRGLMLTVLYVGLLIAGLRLERWIAGPLLGGTIAYGAWWLVSRMDPMRDALLLRGARLGPRHLLLRGLATATIAAALMIVVVTVWQVAQRLR